MNNKKSSCLNLNKNKKPSCEINASVANPGFVSHNTLYIKSVGVCDQQRITAQVNVINGIHIQLMYTCLATVTPPSVC